MIFARLANQTQMMTLLILVAALTVICILLAIFSERLGYFKFALYALVAFFSVPLAVMLDIGFCALVYYLFRNHGKVHLTIGEWGVVVVMAMPPMLGWIFLPIFGMLFVFFSAGWQWLRPSMVAGVCDASGPD